MRFEDALRFLPTANGIPTMMPPEFLSVWADHLRACGFMHRDDVAALAVDGKVEVAVLPKQRVKLQPPVRGPRHNLNNAWRWVPVDEPDPEPMRIPDIGELMPNEQAALLDQFAAAGMIPTPPTGPVTAEEDR